MPVRSLLFTPPALRLALAALVLCAAACQRPAAPPAVRDAAVVAGVNHGVAQMGQYDFDGAVTTFAALAARHPADAAIQVNLALARINRQGEGDQTEADRILRPLVGHADVGTRAKYALALLLLYQGREDEAFPLFRDVTAAAPNDAYAAYFAGQARLNAAPEDALAWFSKARALDPRLRSAAYGAFQALQRLGRGDEAAAMLAEFQALERDPRAELAEFKYTRMGPLAQAFTVDVPPTSETVSIDGPAFTAPSRASTDPGSMPPGFTAWRPGDASLTVADIDGDGALDVFMADAMTGPSPNLLYLISSADARALSTDHPLSRVADVRAALWGDVDDDGLTDVVLVRRQGRTAIWRQSPAGQWRDVTASMRAATPGVDAVDGALFDADHDGDLDVLLVNARGATELLNNNGNGTFRRIAAEAGLAGNGLPARGVVVADLDGDRDHDVLIVKATPPHDVFLNDRVWKYRPASGTEALTTAPIDAAVAGDADADGQVELYTTGPRGIERWQPDAKGVWQPSRLAPADTTTRRAQIALADTDGDGTLEVLASRALGWAAWSADPARAGTPVFDASSTDVSAWTVAGVETIRGGPVPGPSVIGLGPEGPIDWAPGARANYLALAPTGREIASDQRRSNVSGIGTRIAVRRGSRWTAVDTVRTASGPGQSLQPVAIGLGGADKADFVSLVWSDGIFQTEIDLAAGRLHRIEETQRQLSSCPVVFVWDGSRFRFVSDILGVGGIGFLERPGVYSAPHPQERMLLPATTTARHDHYAVVIGEPMEEIAYLDHATLTVYDLPPGWDMALDERKAITGPAPTGAPIFYRRERLPRRAANDRGEDVTTALAAADRLAAPPGAVDPRFIGRTAPHAVTLEFDTPLDDGPGRPVLLADGWVEYPYAQTVFAAWQAGAPYQAPTLEARDGQGRWHVVAREFGYPAGMPRQMSFPLDRLPPGTVALRLGTTQEIYWDRLRVIYAEPAPQVVVRTIAAATATLRASGFAARTTGPQRTPDYDYDRRAPLADTRHPRGWYTQFGPVTPLVADADDAVAIFGPGEDILLEFPEPDAPPPSGGTRRLVLDTRGWCKDMDLYTKDGDTVEPLPGRDTAARLALHPRFNTRYQGGR